MFKILKLTECSTLALKELACLLRNSGRQYSPNDVLSYISTASEPGEFSDYEIFIPLFNDTFKIGVHLYVVFDSVTIHPYQTIVLPQEKIRREVVLSQKLFAKQIHLLYYSDHFDGIRRSTPLRESVSRQEGQ